MSLNLKEKLLDVLSAAVSGPPKDEAAQTIKAVIKGQSVCSAEDKKRIQELDKQYAAAYQTVLSSTYSDAKKGFALHQREQEAAIAAGKFDIDFFDQNDYALDFQQRQAAGKRSMLLISMQAAVISKPICTRVSSILNDEASEVEANAKVQCAQYAIDYPGSPVADRLRQLAITVLARVSSGGGSRPSHYAGYLIN